MRNIVYHIASSLDGFIADRDGLVNAFLMNGDHVEDYLESLQNFQTVIMGAETYRFAFQYGLKAGDLVPIYSHMKHYIYSKQLKFDESSRIQLVHDNYLESIQSLKQQDGSDIYLCGGGRFAGFLMQNKLIDRICVKLNPIVLGKGIKLFELLDQNFELKLIKNKGYESGVVLLEYDVV